MGSRNRLRGTNPVADPYNPRPVPTTQEKLHIYISDELLSLGGRVNSLLSGIIFQPRLELPERVTDGLVFYFPIAVPDSDVTERGIWMYLVAREPDGTITEPETGSWVKIIDIPAP